ncbi:hypothetical protein KQI38_05470 [Tissierella carlieri]|uniref:hypothetical protein n=1 Tax=Tissierella carlieri TaxID=689904 RepID=UPI001C10D490|nr:hypothetical protein [Tissierella carlieri]MBU5311470.1 hypothetical protein [Tissierella carlieri]
MKYTTNYNLNKPEGTDVVNIEDLNANMDTIDTELAKKVDKVSGKGLSTNDYTTTEKNKLAGIAAGANNYIHPSTHPASMIGEEANKKFMTDAERSKLAGIEAGATNYVHPSTHPASMIVEAVDKRFMKDAERIKLAGIEDGANKYIHPGSGTNPHGTTKSDVGLGSVLNHGIATQAEAEAGTSNVKYMTPLRVKELLDANVGYSAVYKAGYSAVLAPGATDIIRIPLGYTPKKFVTISSNKLEADVQNNFIIHYAIDSGLCSVITSQNQSTPNPLHIYVISNIGLSSIQFAGSAFMFKSVKVVGDAVEIEITKGSTGGTTYTKYALLVEGM